MTTIIGENANDARLIGLVEYLRKRCGYLISSTTIEKITDEEPYMISCAYRSEDTDEIMHALNDWCEVENVLHRSMISNDEHEESIVIELLFPINTTNPDMVPCRPNKCKGHQSERACYALAEHDKFCPEHSYE